MKKSTINFSIELDQENIPEKIYWDATDNPNESLNDTKAIAIALWDHYHQGTMKIDLWTKDMEIGDMKRFYIEVMSGIADTLLTATGDQKMANEIDNVCRTLSKHLEAELKEMTK